MTRFLTPYQLILMIVLILWPLAIFALLFLMHRLEEYVDRPEAHSPEEAGLEPVEGEAPEKEVKVIVGDRVVGEPEG